MLQTSHMQTILLGESTNHAPLRTEAETGAYHYSGDSIHVVLHRILVLLQKSAIAHREIADPRLRLWATYKSAAEEFDNELLSKYNGDMDTSLIFVSSLRWDSIILDTQITLYPARPAFSPLSARPFCR